ncbi:hypothetical protein ACN47E_006334 [Coniothyrium glycines]
MSGELQTIPARHGVATFVPRGRTVKVINTYGKQVVSMWAFSLGAPPEDDDVDGGEEEKRDEEQVQKEAEELQKAVEKGPSEKTDLPGTSIDTQEQETETSAQDTESRANKTASTGEEKKPEDDTKESPEKAPDTPDDETTTKSSEDKSKQPQKRTWASYLPAIPYRNKNSTSKTEEKQKPSAEEEKAQNEANTKKWSSYLPTGKSFSSYVPNVQLPDSKEAMSAFKASHYRDPNKSYAEQLYDFSKTPVGAGTIAAATGSGYASSAYAVYSAYASIHSSNSSQPPMEYLSLPHTRASSHKLVPEVDDELLTNLRNPILTLVEDTSPGAHDTLTAACDANQYAALGVDKPEEHGSCAENLVLALKDLNESAGLKGTKAVGADITVNIAPTPLHLFMNTPLGIEGKADDEAAGAKGITLKIEEPKGKKRSFVRFRAERDIVVVFSSCPMDVGKQNGGRCMAANYMVEDAQEGEDLTTSVSSVKSKKATNKLSPKSKPDEKKSDEKTQSPKAKTPETKKGTDAKETLVEADKPKRPAPKKLQSNKNVPKTEEMKQDEQPDELPTRENTASRDSKTEESFLEAPKEKKKPKKLEVRSGGSATSSKSS